MAVFSNDPSWWPVIYWDRVFSYLVVASSTAVVYDWVLTFGQEFKLIWRQHWSLMAVLYICVRYIGMLFSVTSVLFSITNEGCTILWFVQVWTPVVVNAMLGVIMMTRIHAMYQRSKIILIFLVVVLVASTISSAVMTVIANINTSEKEIIHSGDRQCVYFDNNDGTALNNETLTPTFVWETIALFLALWIIMKHFHELRQLHTGSTFIGDCFTVLSTSHMFYFVAFVVASCFSLGKLSPNILSSDSTGDAIYYGVYLIAQVMQMFVLGPRLILSVRAYHTKLITRLDEGIGMTTIAFREREHVSSCGGV